MDTTTQHYFGIVHGSAPHYGISFPDFPGCISGGETLEHLMAMSEEGLSGHIACMIEYDMPIPAPRELEQIKQDPALADALADASYILCVPVVIEISRAA